MASRRGRPPRKPTKLLKLRGSFNPTRDGRARAHEPQPVGDLAEPPPNLTDAQEEVWRYAVQHMPPGVIKKVDRDLFVAWCEAVDRFNTARLMQAMLDRDSKLKLLIKTENGLAPSPYNDILDKCAKTMIRLAQEFGFSPAARPAIRQDWPVINHDDDTPPDPWAGLRLIKGGKT